MIPLECVRAEGLMTAAQARTIDEADAVRLESHLRSCTECRAARDRLAALAALLREAPGASIGEPAMSRAAERALATDVHTPARVRGKVLPWLAAAAAGLVGVGLLVTWPSQDRTVAPREVHASNETSIAIPGVRLALEAGGRLRVVSASEVLLREGRVRVAVHSGTPFSVRTDRFVATVHGTRFAVTTEGVEVWQGRVAVRGTGGASLADLRAGGRWSLAAPPIVAAPAPVAALEPATARLEAKAPRPSVRDVRAALKARDTTRARSLADLLLPVAGRAAAEIASLRADSFRLERRYADAVAAYHEVAARYPSSSFGEQALFVAAELEAGALGRAADARRTALEYRRLHPDGRFAAEVDRILGGGNQR